MRHLNEKIFFKNLVGEILQSVKWFGERMWEQALCDKSIEVLEIWIGKLVHWIEKWFVNALVTSEHEWKT